MVEVDARNAPVDFMLASNAPVSSLPVLPTTWSANWYVHHGVPVAGMSGCWLHCAPMPMTNVNPTIRAVKRCMRTRAPWPLNTMKMVVQMVAATISAGIFIVPVNVSYMVLTIRLLTGPIASAMVSSLPLDMPRSFAPAVHNPLPRDKSTPSTLTGMEPNRPVIWSMTSSVRFSKVPATPPHRSRGRVSMAKVV